jgi:hypothetical protein
MGTNIKKVRIQKGIRPDPDGLPEVQIIREEVNDEAEGEDVFLIEEIITDEGKYLEKCVDPDPLKLKIYREMIEGREVDTG